MDDYQKLVIRSLPDDYFVPTTDDYKVLNIWHGSSGGPPRVEIEYVKKESLRIWARDGPRGVDKKGLRCIFQGLIISTHDYNDFPVDISREDLEFVVESCGISCTYASLLFAYNTTYMALDRRVCWYYGFPGLRALSCTETGESCARAIITVSESIQQSFEEDVMGFSFLTHPLMLALAIRACALRQSERLMKVHVNSLREAERLTGFHADYEDDSEIETLQDVSMAHSFDLGRLSKKAGNDAANLGNFKIILAQLGSMKDMLRVDGKWRWQHIFDSQPASFYFQESEDLIELDAMFESLRKGLLEAIVEYQNRARSLQSVIFTLIAKEDANASILLAKESRAIAVATKNDGTSMKTIAIMTMIFLPATFYAALFAMPTLQWEQSPVVQTKFWIYWAFTVPSTVVIMLAWYFIAARQMESENPNAENKADFKNLRNGEARSKDRSYFRSLTATGKSHRHSVLGSEKPNGLTSSSSSRVDNKFSIHQRMVQKEKQDQSSLRGANNATCPTITARDVETSLAHQMA